MPELDERRKHLGMQVIALSESGQPCDITFYDHKPKLDVVITNKIGIALMYGAGAKKLAEMLNAIGLSDGSTVGIGEIWTVHPMPVEGISGEALAAVDIALGDEMIDGVGKTIREMISDTYHCDTDDERDRFLRRFLAS